MRHYHELLPSYLKGNNINIHGSILDEQDAVIHQVSMKLKNLFNLCCYISFDSTGFNVSIPDEAITKVTVSIAGETLLEDELLFDEYDVVSEYDYTYESPLSSDCTITVTVTCANERIISKIAHYDNDKSRFYEDTPQENLDIIGTLLGIPRNIDELDSSYVSRLKYFLDHYNGSDLIHLMYCIHTGKNLNRNGEYNMLSRTTSIPHYIRHLYGLNAYLFDPSSYGGEIENKIDLNNVIDKYCMITRKYAILENMNSILQLEDPAEISSFYNILYQNTFLLLVTLLGATIDYPTNKPIYLAPVKLYVGNNLVRTFITDKNSLYSMQTLYGYNSRLHGMIRLVYDGEYEITGCTFEAPIPSDSFTLQLPAWKYGSLRGTPYPLTSEPYNENEELIPAGNGFIFTPLADMDLFRATDKNIGFYLRLAGIGGSSRLYIFGKESITEEKGAYTLVNPFLIYNPNNYTDTEYEYYFDIIDDVLYMYYSDSNYGVVEYTGLSYDLSDYDGTIYFGYYHHGSNIYSHRILEANLGTENIGTPDDI